jgi:hypothetical protein
MFGCSSDDGGTTPDAAPDVSIDSSSDMAVDVLEPDQLVRKLEIKSIIPDNGPSCPFNSAGQPGNCDGTIPITLIGDGFKLGATVYINGGDADIITTVNVPSKTTLSFSLKKQPYDTAKPTKVGIRVSIGGETSNEVYFQYHVTKPATAEMKGSITTDSTEALRDYPSPTAVKARILIKGKTDTTIGKAAGVKAQVGIGPVGEDPTKSLRFSWQSATFKSDDGQYDIYEANVTPSLEGNFDIAYRISDDNGKHWVYIDKNEADLAYSPADASKLTATKADPLYCTKDEHCEFQGIRNTCRIDPKDWKAHRCVECVDDTYCKNNPDTVLGAKCGANGMCTCGDASHCTNHAMGKLCLTLQVDQQGNTITFCSCAKVEGGKLIADPKACADPNATCNNKPVVGLPVAELPGCISPGQGPDAGPTADAGP